MNVHGKFCILWSPTIKSWSLSQGITTVHVFHVTALPNPKLAMQQPLPNLFTRSGAVNGVSKEEWQLFVLSKEFLDLKLAPPYPLDHMWPPLLQNQTLLRKKHISLPDPQCPPPWRATRTMSIKVTTLPNPKLAMQQPLTNLLTRFGAVLWCEQWRMTKLGFGVGGGWWRRIWRINGRVDGSTDKRPGQAGRRTRAIMRGWVGRPSRAGKMGRGRRTWTGCPSMNVARGRRPTNARSTKIRRSLEVDDGGLVTYKIYFVLPLYQDTFCYARKRRSISMS